MRFVEFKEGDVIDNSIEITGIKEGGLGRIYFGFCRNRRITVAIKTFLKSIWEKHSLSEKWPDIKDKLIAARLPSRSIDIGEYLFFTFFREARLVCQSRHHSNVIKGTRFWWTDSGQPFYECDFLENSMNIGDLNEKMKNETRKKRLSVLELAHIGISFCNGMIYVGDEMTKQYNKSHPDNPAALFVHRDIKPENIMIDDSNTIKIIDMGLAKFQLAKTTTFFVNFPLFGGVYKYMSPEQSISYESVTPASDIYSFGVTMYDLLGGDSFSAYNASKSSDDIVRIEGIPEEFHQIVAKCMRADMTQRYQNFHQLKKDLVTFIDDVKKGKIRLRENIRCESCGYISPEYQVMEGVETGDTVQAPSGHKMVRVPAGEFYKGCSDAQKRNLTRKLGSPGALDNEPYEKVYLDAFDMDTYAVTNEQYHRFIKEAGYQKIPDHWKKGKGSEYSYPEGEENFPVVNVSFNDAQAYCEWAGLRLPTGDEWEKAARGTEGRMYPWGDEYFGDRCNSAESRNRRAVAVDEYPEGTSPYGCFQMVGNVFEWVDEAHPQGDDYKYLRGGCWAVSCEVLGPPFFHYIASPRNSIQASSQKDIFGFRCARDAKEPVVEITRESEEIEQNNCPLCGGGFVEFKLEDIKVPEKSIYTWRGYFDIE